MSIAPVENITENYEPQTENSRQMPSSSIELIISDYTFQAYDTNQSGNGDNINFDFLMNHIPETPICSFEHFRISAS